MSVTPLWRLAACRTAVAGLKPLSPLLPAVAGRSQELYYVAPDGKDGETQGGVSMPALLDSLQGSAPCSWPLLCSLGLCLQWFRPRSTHVRSVNSPVCIAAQFSS